MPPLSSHLAHLTGSMNDASQKGDVITYLIAEVRLPEHREALFRQWCRYYRVSVLRSDLATLIAGRRRDTQRDLFQGDTDE